jgi:hypothetical protein
MSLFRRRKPAADPFAAFREDTIAAGEPDITSLLQEHDIPFQRKAEAWLIEVGGAWATFAWMPRDASLAGWLEYAERPGSSTDLLRAQTATGLAAYEVMDGRVQTKLNLPAEHLDGTGLRLALASLAREAGGPEEPATPAAPAAPDSSLDAALRELPVDPGEANVLPLGDIVEVRIELGPAAPEEAMAEWMLEQSGIWGSRLGLDESGTLWAISAVPGRPATAGGLAWALAGAGAIAGHYRSVT